MRTFQVRRGFLEDGFPEIFVSNKQSGSLSSGVTSVKPLHGHRGP